MVAQRAQLHGGAIRRRRARSRGGPGRARARPSPMEEAPPMKPTQPTERSSGAMVRHAGEEVMVPTQMASPCAAAITWSTSSGFIGWSCASESRAPWRLARGQADEQRRGAAPRPAHAVVLGDELHVVRPLEARVRHAEHVEQRLARSAPSSACDSRGSLSASRLEEPDHVEDGHAPVDGDAAQRVHRGVEARRAGSSRSPARPPSRGRRPRRWPRPRSST